jgi:hypothetical protein
MLLSGYNMRRAEDERISTDKLLDPYKTQQNKEEKDMKLTRLPS